MEVYFTPDVEAKLNALATETGRAADEFVQDAMAGYFEELAQVRSRLDSRYDSLKRGKVKPIDGETLTGGTDPYDLSEGAWVCCSTYSRKARLMLV
jgi:hypothetical protein